MTDLFVGYLIGCVMSILVVLVLLSVGTYNINDNTIKEAMLVCDSNEGVDYIDYGFIDYDEVICNNGGLFILGKK